VEQIQSLEEDAESLRERSLKFYKGCRKYTYVLYVLVFALIGIIKRKASIHSI
jgi:hypothetical protein